MTEEDILTAQSGGPVDIMITHDSPYGAPNAVTDDYLGQLSAMKYFGAESLSYCTEHRKLLQRVTDVTTPRLLIHGHYHTGMKGTYIHGDEKHTIGDVIGLHEGRGPFWNHVHVFDFDLAKMRIEELDKIKK